MKSPQPITLYMTLGCHLCDETLALLAQIIHQQQLPIVVEQVDIVHDEVIYQRYCERIPVLRRDDGEELSYPFVPENLADWLKSA